METCILGMVVMKLHGSMVIHSLDRRQEGTSLEVLWLRLCTPKTGGGWVQSLVGELDPTCCK